MELRNIYPFALTSELPIGSEEPRPFIELFVENPLSRARLRVRALVDTGAVKCGIRKDVAEKLRLTPLQSSLITSANHRDEKPLYEVNLLFPNLIHITNQKVSEFDIGNGFEFILGIRLLQYCDIALTHRNGRYIFSLRVPPVNTPIDFRNM